MTEPLIRASRTGSFPAKDLFQDTAEQIDRSAYFGVNGVSHAEEELDSPPTTPRWVKWFGVGAVVLFLVFAGMHLTGLAPMHDMPMHGVQLP